MENITFLHSRAKWLPLYEQLKTSVEEVLGRFEVYETKNTIKWKHTSTFVVISAKKEGMIVGLASDCIQDSWQPIKTVQTSKNRVEHYFEVTDATIFPQLIDRIMKAYHLTKTTNTKKVVEKLPEFSTIDEYIELFDGEIKDVLIKTRQTIQQAAPKAIEKISWKMPTFYQEENLIHFAAGKDYLGVYPGSSGVAAFLDKLTSYKTSKGAIQFPYAKEIPYALIAEITRFRVTEVEKRKNKC